MRCGGNWRRDYGASYPGTKGETPDTAKEPPTDYRASSRPYQVEILRAGNQLTHFVGTQDRGQPTVALRSGQLLLQLAPLEHPHKEEAQGGDMEPHRPHGELLLTKQVGVIPPKGLGAELIEATTAVVALAGAKRVQVGPNRGRGIVPPDQFVVHPL